MSTAHGGLVGDVTRALRVLDERDQQWRATQDTASDYTTAQRAVRAGVALAAFAAIVALTVRVTS